MKEKPAGPGRIEVRNVTKAYGIGRFAKPAVSDCSFIIEPGKLTVMIGPSGAGKSTIIKLLAGFEMPTSGTVLMDGRPITGPGSDRLVVFQESALYPWMTTYENILYGPQSERRVRIESRRNGDTPCWSALVSPSSATPTPFSSPAACNAVPSSLGR